MGGPPGLRCRGRFRAPGFTRGNAGRRLREAYDPEPETGPGGVAKRDRSTERREVRCHDGSKAMPGDDHSVLVRAVHPETGRCPLHLCTRPFCYFGHLHVPSSDSLFGRRGRGIDSAIAELR